MKVFLVSPPQPKKDLVSNLSKGEGFILPYSLLCIATYLNYKKHKAKVLDCPAEHISNKNLYDIIKKEKPDVVGLTAFTFTIPKAYNAAETIKKASPNTKVALGGIHASVLPIQCLKECRHIDFVVIGEGEYVFERLLEALEKKGALSEVSNLAYREGKAHRLTKKEHIFLDPNKLPLPDYSLLNMDRYVPHRGNYKDLPCYSFYTSRGCPFQCSFCSANINMGRMIRRKSINRCIKEIKILVNKYGARGLIIQDSTFTIQKEWVRNFCKALLKNNIRLSWRANTRADCVDLKTLKLMKKAGCYRINVGFESGNQETLDFINKGTTLKQNKRAAYLARKAGLQIGSSFIIGLPNEGMKEVMNTIRFAKEIKAKHAQFYLPIPYPGTKLMDLCKKYGGVRENTRWEDFGSRDFSNAVYINKNFDKETFKNLPNMAFRRFYLDPKTVARLIFTIGSFHELKDTLGTLKSIAKKAIFNRL